MTCLQPSCLSQRSVSGLTSARLSESLGVHGRCLGASAADTAEADNVAAVATIKLRRVDCMFNFLGRTNECSTSGLREWQRISPIVQIMFMLYDLGRSCVCQHISYSGVMAHWHAPSKILTYQQVNRVPSCVPSGTYLLACKGRPPLDRAGSNRSGCG